MTTPDATIHDDTRDAIALLTACINDDTDAATVIHQNCDLDGVLAIITGIAISALVEQHGEDGTREMLARKAAEESAL
jgi:hypothetical protein